MFLAKSFSFILFIVYSIAEPKMQKPPDVMSRGFFGARLFFWNVSRKGLRLGVYPSVTVATWFVVATTQSKRIETMFSTGR